MKESSVEIEGVTIVNLPSSYDPSSRFIGFVYDYRKELSLSDFESLLIKKCKEYLQQQGYVVKLIH